MCPYIDIPIVFGPTPPPASYDDGADVLDGHGDDDGGDSDMFDGNVFDAFNGAYNGGNDTFRMAPALPTVEEEGSWLTDLEAEVAAGVVVEGEAEAEAQKAAQAKTQARAQARAQQQAQAQAESAGMMVGTVEHGEEVRNCFLLELIMYLCTFCQSTNVDF
jgi:hypothetical protein